MAASSPLEFLPSEVDYQHLDSIPSLASEYRQAMKGAIPGVSGTRDTSVPTTAFTVAGVKVDLNNLAEYCRICRLRLTNELPLTYPYAMTFALVMKAMTSPDFPFAAVGTVHLRNEIEAFRPLLVDEEFDVYVHSENVRRHPRGLMVDLITHIVVDGELVWRQVATMLSKGKYPESAGPLDDREPLAKQLGEVAVDPTSTVTVTANDISTYATVSGDKNPIHISTLGAKAFGFPGVIAHGMWTAASLLAIVEGKIPNHAKYTVEFGKPVVLPAKLSLLTRNDAENDRIALQYVGGKKADKVHVTATVEKLS